MNKVPTAPAHADLKDNYIGGRFVAGPSARPSVNPSDLEDIIGYYAEADTRHLDDAIAAARSGAAVWGGAPLEQRQRALMAIGNELCARSQELGELLSREEGKPRAEGVGEVFRSGQFFQYFAAEALRVQGSTADSVRPGIEIDVRREPLGVVAVISPWNFPLATASWKIAPALAFGNAVIWKPASVTPAIAWALTEIVSRQDLPAGTFNLVMGSGAVVGNGLAASPDIDAITFTGSYEVGRDVAVKAAPNLTRIQLEMGSKNALVVMDDADLDLAVAHALNGAYFGSGQKCTASSRLIVHRAIHDAFVEKLKAATEALVVGHALDNGTQIGPLVDARQLEQALAYAKLAETEGCERVCGGVALERRTRGHYFQPALFINSRNDMRVNREEMFCPIACVIRVDSYEEALAVANDTQYGLTSGIMTRSLAHATHFRRNIKTGCVMVNLPTAGTDYHVPFGGRKKSSYGPREQGQVAVEFFTVMKTAYINSGAPV
ncbi:MAG: aldehyde dehydrogenase family protein [Pseudorhodoplanes sp.]|nr:aldehyde dehydrogenase family protein [Pseudorhodoplanes sp.]